MQVNEHVAAFENEYRLLSRMHSDCKYYLGLGARHSKYLWGKGVKDHIAHMKALWNGFPADKKPEWLSMEEIESLESQMDKTLLFSAVTLTADDYETTFYVSGIPRDQDDLSNHYGSEYDDFVTDNLEEGTEISVHVEAYTFGEGETVAASHEELCQIVDLERLIPDLLSQCCDNIEALDFSFTV